MLQNAYKIKTEGCFKTIYLENRTVSQRMHKKPRSS